MANAILIWDNNKDYAEELCNSLGISFSEDVCFSMKELKSNKFLHGKDAVIVLLETNIENHKRTAFYGLKIIEELRKEFRFKGVIVAYSSYSHENLKDKKNTEVLITSGTWLKPITEKGLNASEIEELIERFPRMSDDLLDDIVFSAFDNKGKIHEYLHNLKNDLNIKDTTDDLKQIKEKIAVVFEVYRKLLLKGIDPEKIVGFSNLFNSLKKETMLDIEEHWKKKEKSERFSYANGGNHVSKYSKQIAELAPLSGSDIDSKNNEKINWEVLFLDDKEDIRKIIFDFFKSKGVRCHLAATEKDVENELKKHGAKVSLFLTDIRLLDTNEHWHDRQGYDVIEQVNKANNYSLIYSVLTSKKGTINKMVQKKRKYDIQWFTKEDVINNVHSFNIFFDLIKKYAEENFISNTVFQPTLGYWNKSYNGFFFFPLKTYYKVHKETKDYEGAESRINNCAMEWVGGNGVVQEWQSKLKKQFIDDTELKLFREYKLQVRRIVLALCAEGVTTQNLSIYNKLKGKNETDPEKVKTFFSVLALSATNVESHIYQAKSYFNEELSSPDILYEEYEFLKNEFFEEEFIDSINLGYEKDGLNDLMKEIAGALNSENISEPASFVRVNNILKKRGIPKSARLDTMLAELNKLDEQSKNRLLKNAKKHSFLKSVNNEILKELFRKHEWI